MGSRYNNRTKNDTEKYSQYSRYVQEDSEKRLEGMYEGEAVKKRHSLRIALVSLAAVLGILAAVCPVMRFAFPGFFLKEADRLIASGEYRREQGDRLRRAMMQRDQFNSLVLKTLETNESQRPLEDYPVDFRILDDRWYYLEKAGYLDTMPYIYGTLGARDCFRYAPGLFLKRNVGKMFDKRRSAR